ncbi:MAG TPA: adenylyltransferase/cytidyltransferase family protein [Candidatus Saccharimonadales bacterium]|nr:adenylyltransferase/cytidyltransferase family protein [Candidatus Saccharimonadales bacterium]
MVERKIGLFAGVFDPIHLGHTHFVKQAIKDKRLDRVYILIEQEPQYKTGTASYEDRKNMVMLAVKTIPQAEVYESSSPYFPITSSLPDIKKAEPDAKLYLLIGDDVAAHLNEWQDKEALNDVELIVAARGREEPQTELSSLKIRKELADTGESAGLDPAVLEYCRAKDLY